MCQKRHIIRVEILKYYKICRSYEIHFVLLFTYLFSMVSLYCGQLTQYPVPFWNYFASVSKMTHVTTDTYCWVKNNTCYQPQVNVISKFNRGALFKLSLFQKSTKVWLRHHRIEGEVYDMWRVADHVANLNNRVWRGQILVSLEKKMRNRFESVTNVWLICDQFVTHLTSTYDPSITHQVIHLRFICKKKLLFLKK